MPESEWVQNTRTRIAEIKDLKPSIDKLELSADIAKCIIAISISLGGWITLLSRLEAMHQFSQSELVEILQEMQKITVEFLTLDIDATVLYESKPHGSTEEPKLPNRAV